MASFNEAFQNDILPVIIVFIVYNFVGLFGNILVQYVYSFHYPKNHFRCLVLTLSLVDLTSCCTTVPMETVSTWFWFNAPFKNLCKAKNFFVQFTGLSAIYLLFVTAVYKYRQICKPFGKQLSQRTIVVICVTGIFFSTILASPAAILWDINNHTVTFNNISETAFICEVHKSFHFTIYPEMYRHFLSAYTLFLLATVILYCFVARSTILHYRRLKNHSKSRATFINPTFSGNEISAQHNTENGAGEKCRHKCGSSNQILNDEAKSSNSCLATISNHSKVTETRHASSFSHLTPGQIRKVIIMAVIAGSFSITFFMALGFGYIFAVRDYGDFYSLRDLVILFCCYRFYFINYAINPVVYFALDGYFRKEVVKVVCCCRKR